MGRAGTTILHGDLLAKLRQMLLDGEIHPGARIAEQALCARFGVSRTPLREALKVLAAEGHIVLLPNRGARAAKLTRKDVQELFEVAEGLEALAGELACRKITDREIEDLKAMHAEMVRCHAARELPEYYALNRRIHEAIVRAADNTALWNLYEAVDSRIRRARFVAPMSPEHWDLAMCEHDAIMNALIRRDGAVLASILKTHLRHKREDVERAGFAEPEPQPRGKEPGRRANQEDRL